MTVITASGPLNIRETPSASAAVIYTAANGSTMQCIETSSVSGFYRVSNASGTGWGSTEYLTTGSGGGSSAIGDGINVGQTLQLTATNVNVRQSAPSGAVLWMASSPEKYVVMGKQTVSGYVWYQIQKTSLGWLRGDFVKLATGGGSNPVETIGTEEFKRRYPNTQGLTAKLVRPGTGHSFNIYISWSNWTTMYHMECTPLTQNDADAINDFIDYHGVRRDGNLWQGIAFNLVMPDGGTFTVGSCLYGHGGGLPGGVSLTSAREAGPPIPSGHFDTYFKDSNGGGGWRGDGSGPRYAAETGRDEGN